MWNKWTLLALFGLIGPATAFRCHSCEGLCGCLNPSTVECSVNTECYTVKHQDSGKIMRKGCTSNCNLVNYFDGMCSLCRGPSCNTETSLTPMNGYDECQNDLGQGVGRPSGLGQGVNQPQGLGNQGLGNQGLGNQGFNQPQPQGLGNQGLGNQGLGNQGLGNQGLNYKPAPSIGSNNQYGQQRYNDNDGIGQGYGYDGGMGQGYNNGNNLGQGYNGNNNLGQGYNGNLGQGYGNSALRYTLNSFVLGAAAYVGLNRL
ncbi:hypothetical protein M3Y97_00986300 [Aphelenchoides bicaudatus]|nr:hypothetical protein M3Y97_00986300 [Aphelenchoides bicaudatus]